MGTCEGGVKERGGRNAKLNSNRLREKKKKLQKKILRHRIRNNIAIIFES